MKHVIETLEERREGARLGGGQKRIDAQHAPRQADGARTARPAARPRFLRGIRHVRPASLRDFGMDKGEKIPGDGVVTGWGTVNGRVVYVFAKDFTVFGGSLSEAHAQKIIKIQDMALQSRADHRSVRRRRRAHPGRRRFARRLCRCVPAQCAGFGRHSADSLIMGPCAGGDVYSPAMTDFIFMVKDTSYMFVTGPDVVKTVTHER